MSLVFIIDDDPIHQRIAQIMVEKHQIFERYTSFLEAEIALDFLRANQSAADQLPDVILLDLNMPRFNGWDFLDKYGEIASLIKPIRIFIVTSSIDEKDKLKAKSYDYVSGFISKPLSAAIIRSTNER